MEVVKTTLSFPGNFQVGLETSIPILGIDGPQFTQHKSGIWAPYPELDLDAFINEKPSEIVGYWDMKQAVTPISIDGLQGIINNGVSTSETELSPYDIQQIKNNAVGWKWDTNTQSYLTYGDAGYGEAKKVEEKIKGFDFSQSATMTIPTVLTKYGLPLPNYKDDMPSGFVPAELAKFFPNMNALVDFPCKHSHVPCKYSHGPESIPAVIIHLNDQHKWSREKIADWLDTLDVDLTLASTSIGD